MLGLNVMLAKLVPILLASSSPIRTATTTVTTTTTTATTIPTPVATAATISTPNSLKEIRHGMDQMYLDLVDDPGHIIKELSPTLRFAYVSPPINGTSTWRKSATFVNVNATIGDDDHLQRHLESLHTEMEINKKNKKPIAIYLPGLDGTGISAFNHQFDDLATTFELWRLVIDTKDRSEFHQILRLVVEFIQDIVNDDNDNREITLIGESFGGVLASATALQLQKRAQSKSKQQQAANKSPLRGLVLVNPATAFHETNWDTIVPLLASLQYLSNKNETTTGRSTPTPYSMVGGMALSYLMPDGEQFGRIVEIVLNAVGIPPSSETVQDMYALLDILEERLPAETLKHRVSQWLSVGAPLVNERLQDLKIPTFVVAGDQDRIMPSGTEVDRLVKVIPSCEKLVVRGKGHIVLDENVNLTEAILYSDIDPLQWKQGSKKAYDPILDWTLPPPEQVKQIIESQVQPLRNIHSPVFFSTDTRSKRWRGLSKVPVTDNPILFVANHQLCTYRIFILVSRLFAIPRSVSRQPLHTYTCHRSRS